MRPVTITNEMRGKGLSEEIQVQEVEVYQTFAEAVASVATNVPAILQIERIENVTANLTIPANIKLQFNRRGRVRVSAGATLTVVSAEQIMAGDRDYIFECLTDLVLADGAVVFQTGGRVVPQWWGAAANGVRDDTVEIQKAIDSIKTAGGLVYLPTGQYELTTDNALAPFHASRFTAIIIDDDNVHIRGDGDSTILHVEDWELRATNDCQSYIGIGSVTKDIRNVRIEAIKFTGELDVDTPAESTDAANCVAIAVGPGYTTRTVSNCGVAHCTFENTGTAILMNGGDSDPGNDGQCEGCYVVDCRIEDIGRLGIGCQSGGHANSIIARNRINKTRGIGIEWSGMRAEIIHNILVDTEQGGISVVGVSTQTGWSQIANNVLLRAGAYNDGTSSPSIQIGQGTGAFHYRVTGNTIRNAYGQGIYVDNDAEDIHISDNVIDVFGYDLDSRSLGVAGNAGICVINASRIVIVNNVIKAGAGGTDDCDTAIMSGGGSAEDNWVDGNVAYGSYDTRPFYTVCSPGSGGAGTRCFAGRNVDGTTGAVYTLGNSSGVQTIPAFASADTTPSVLGSNVFETGGADTYTDFDDGIEGQIITIISRHAAVFDTTGTSLTGSSVDLTTAVGDVTQWISQDGSTWRLIAFVDNSADNSGGA